MQTVGAEDEDSMKAAWILALLIAAIHVILALFFAVETPYRTPGRLMINARAPIADVGAPDERQHANYIQHLLDGKGFPVFQPNSPEVGEHYEDHQPPLYYVVAAGFARLVGVTDVADSNGIKLRWLNAAIGGLSIFGVFFFGLWSTGRAEFGLGGAGIAAVLPMNCALSGAISNDPLLFALCTWTLALIALALRRGWDIKLALATGTVVGLAILTKTTAVALLPILIVAFLIPQKKRPDWKQWAGALVLIAILAGPWLIRNQSLYGDPLAQKVFQSAFTGSAHRTAIIDQIKLENALHGETGNPPVQYWRDWVAWWTARSFIGTFGYMDIWLNETGSPYGGAPNIVYRILLAGCAVLLLGWLASFFRADGKEGRGAQILGLIFLLLVVGLFVGFNATYFQGQGRYLYPAIAPICVGMAIGASVLFKLRGSLAVGIFVTLLLLVNVYALAKLPGEFAKRANGVSMVGHGDQSLG